MSNLNKLLRDIHARADSLAMLAHLAAKLDAQSSLKSGYVGNVMQILSALQCLQSDLLAVVQAEQVRKPTNTQSYTDLNGKIIVPGDSISVWLNCDMQEVEV